jgi:hypothetical protein
MGTDPPGNPEDPEVSAREALGWALVSGIAIGLTRRVATRGVTRFFRDLYAEVPEDANKVA